MSNPISHDRAYAQKNYRREDSRKRPRIEDESHLIPVAELPAESPRLIPIVPPIRTLTIKFDTPHKRRRRIRRSANESTESFWGSTESAKGHELELPVQPLTGHSQKNDSIETRTSDNSY